MTAPRPRTLALIPARGGSKRLPHKNVLPFCGRPLVAWTVAAALDARTIDRVILSTDDTQIADAARAAGCDVPFMRPPELAGDTASSMDVIFHALDVVDGEWDELVLLQPTSPLRTGADIDACVERRRETGALGVVSVTPLGKPGNHFGRLTEAGRFRRDDVFAGSSDDVVCLNGAVYVARIADLRTHGSFYDETTRAYSMPWDRSLDIDELADFRLAEALMKIRLDTGGA